MKRTLAALAIATLASVSVAAIAPAFAQPDSATTGDRGDMRRQHDGKHWGHGARSERIQMRIAQHLNTVETLIGIRADQQDAWRDYTNAVLAMFQRPARPDASADEAKDAAKAPFAREERLIAITTERAAKAADLQKAIDALKAKLSQEQLQKLADAQLRFGPPMRGHGRDHGPGRDNGRDNGPRDQAPNDSADTAPRQAE
ncbi:hypothetical protein K32_00030 [Kaistia sp. 32K]|uniref:hypothetical protein n=1 Tax=Kaistia sp. 32K TaxID=2795690 RepID=UPI001915A771|nr:hypothetical protein [Kaistia sp. 32K]BCP51386.1 hypothetical protein K32_00030 [Kaistia sp. 32K]